MNLILNNDEMQMVEKLVDAGMTKEQSYDWVQEIVTKAMEGTRAVSPHSCSCHTREQGACDVCKDFGCKVWDFNQVAVPKQKTFYLLSTDDGQPRPVDIPEEKFAEFAGMNPHVIHFVVEE